jgi:hypothetical protein
LLAEPTKPAHPVSVAAKSCARCGQSKPADAFRANPRNRDGLRSYCIACEVERNREWRAQHRDSLNALRRERYAANSQQERTRCLAGYHRRKRGDALLPSGEPVGPLTRAGFGGRLTNGRSRREQDRTAR